MIGFLFSRNFQLVKLNLRDIVNIYLWGNKFIKLYKIISHFNLILLFLDVSSTKFNLASSGGYNVKKSKETYGLDVL